MSSRELEENQQEQANKELADFLGIEYEELCQLDWEIEANESSEGLTYGYILQFSEDSSPEILQKIDGLDKNRTIRIDASLFQQQ